MPADGLVLQNQPVETWLPGGRPALWAEADALSRSRRLGLCIPGYLIVRSTPFSPPVAPRRHREASTCST